MKQTCVVPFFKSGAHVIEKQTTPVVIPDTESRVFNNQIYAGLTLEVKGSSGAEFPISLKGSIDFEGDVVWSKLAGVKLDDLSVVDEITEPGLYSFSIDGVRHLKTVVTASGTATITGCCTE